MFIYAIGTKDRQKIGYSKDPRTRLKTLQTSNPEELILHYAFPVNPKTVEKFEAHIHKEQNHKRIRGEWFTMDKKEVTNLMTFYEISTETIEAML